MFQLVLSLELGSVVLKLQGTSVRRRFPLVALGRLRIGGVSHTLLCFRNPLTGPGGTLFGRLSPHAPRLGKAGLRGLLAHR